MEIEFFCHPEESADWYKYWRDTRFKWYVDLGLRSDRLRLRDHDPDELAFYSIGTADIEYSFPFGVSELEGIAHRSDYDLTQHQKFSGKDLSYFDEERWERDKAKLGMNSFKEYLKSREGLELAGWPYQYVPHVIEPSAGADRATLAFLCEAYTEDEVGGEARTVLKFHPRLAPIKAAVFPLVKKDGMPEMAEKIYRDLKRHFNVFFDEKGAIGRRYRRQDEAGTPFGITVDGQTPDRRDRDVPRPRQLPPVARSLRRRRRRRCATCSKDNRSPRRAEPGSDRRKDRAIMKPCISQATTLSTPFEADLTAYARGGWTAVELWLTKLETYLESHSVAEARRLLDDQGLEPVAASFQGGLLLTRGDEREAHWDHFRRRLSLLQELEVPLLIVAADFTRELAPRRLRPGRRRARRGRRGGGRVPACGWRSSSRRAPGSAPASTRRWP